MNMERKTILILIAGGAGAGKTTTAAKIVEYVQKKEKKEEAAILLQTDYFTNVELKNCPPPYLKEGVIDFVEVGKYYGNISNYDEDLILDKIKAIADKEQTKVIVFEGVVSLSFDKISNFAGLKIFIDIDDDIKLIRRIQRSNYYKKLAGEEVDETKGLLDFGSSIKESFDLWMWRKKIRSMDYDYNKNIKSKKRCADLALDNNYPEDLERNFSKIISLIDLYFENEELFKNQLEKENQKKSENTFEVVEKMQEELKKLQEEKQVWEQEKNSLNKQIQKLQLQVNQQDKEWVAKIEELKKS